MIFKLKGASGDAILLTIARIVTMLMGFVCIKIVSVFFSLDSFGLYSQALLIINTATSLSILGMTDAVNYFYNNKSNNDVSSSDELVGTIFGLQTIVGAICGIGIIIGAPFLTDYFGNPSLVGVIGWIAFQPLLQNFIPMIQVLYMSAGRARSIVVINLVISIVRLMIFLAATFVTHNIVTIIALTLISDIFQVLYFLWDLRCHSVVINLKKFKLSLCKPVLCYAIPMAAFVVVNSLMRDVDKWIIGYLGNTEELAIYTNCSKLLPFDMLTYSFCIVLIPMITKNISTNKVKASFLFGNYLNIGLYSTSILVIPAIFLSRDLLLSLYAPKFLPGLVVFIIYLIVDLSRFANVSLLYSASGRSSELLKIVLVTLLINGVVAIFLYKTIGFTGPAFATLFSLWISYVFYLRGSNKILNTSVVGLLNFRNWLPVLLELCLLSCVALYIGHNYLHSWNVVPRFALLYFVVVGVVGLINRNYIISFAKSINSISNS